MAKLCKHCGKYPVFAKELCRNCQYLRTDSKKPKPLKRTALRKGILTNKDKSVIRKRIKPISDKRAKEMQTYKVMRMEFLQERPKCEICIALKEPVINDSTEVHHKWSGKDRATHFLDISSWLAVCREHHIFLHSNPKWARENEFLN
jgi:hypothetical protein